MSAPGDAPREVLLSERRGEALLLTLNRPAVRNAVDMPLARAIAAALDELDADPDLRAGVLTGAGAGFCAGVDLRALRASGEPPVVPGRGFAGVGRSPRKPLIAAVEGFALGGGLEIALACDLIVAAEGAALGLPEVKLGLLAAAGGLLWLPRRLPLGVAMEMALTGEPIGAGRAHELGLVNRLAEPGGTVELALELAAAIAANGPLAVAASKQILRGQRCWGEEEGPERQRELAEPVLRSADAAEGLAAFEERRAPRWSGR